MLRYERHRECEEMVVIEHQPKRSNETAVYVSPPQIFTYPEYTEETSGGVCHMCSDICVALLWILFCPLSCLITLLKPFCSLKSQTTAMACLKCYYLGCCCAFDCVTPLSLSEAMMRYEETPMQSSQSFITSVIRNKFVISIMETLNEELPDFFFSFLPSGSLREQFGRLLPSSSILASDIDIMVIPDAVSVGEENVKYEATHQQTPVFEAISSAEHPDSFVWLKLEDKYLTQWERFCLRRHYKDQGASFLSSIKVLALLRKRIESSEQIRTQVENHLNRYINRSNIIVTVAQSGPALNVKIRTSETINVCLGMHQKKQSCLFDADFTLALHCCFWPKEALDFFRPERRINWPEQEIVDTIKRLGCHVVPKRSTDALIKLTTEQAEYTTYGNSPGLEWRYSFSQAEMLLADNVPPQARTAFLSFKAINKRHLNLKGRKMSSYVLKTIFLYVLEKKAKDFWNSKYEVAAEETLLEMLQCLRECFESRVCPHYWIPTINVLADLNGSDCARKLKLLTIIIEDPKKYIADQWLEYTRWIRLHCCYCGPSGYKPYFIPSSEVQDTHVDGPCYCCSCHCSYENKPGLCGPCGPIKDFDVY